MEFVPEKIFTVEDDKKFFRVDKSRNDERFLEKELNFERFVLPILNFPIKVRVDSL